MSTKSFYVLYTLEVQVEFKADFEVGVKMVFEPKKYEARIKARVGRKKLLH